MGRDREAAEKLRVLLERAVEDLATGAGTIQQRLADAYLYCHLGEEANLHPELVPEVYALQMDLRSAMTTVHDSERGTAAASAALLSDEHAIILARRILDAARALRGPGGS